MSRAPLPRYTAKPDPLTFTPRSRSTSPSALPMSQCGFTPSDGRGVPQLRTMTLCSSSPSGTSGSVTFGNCMRMPLNSLSTVASSASSRAISSPSARLLAMSSVASSPARLSFATACVSAFRDACRSCTACISARRSRSSSSLRSSTVDNAPSSPRRRIASRSSSGRSRTSLMSCISSLECYPVRRRGSRSWNPRRFGRRSAAWRDRRCR